MEKLTQYLVYKKNPLRTLGLVGLKAAHLEANPLQNKKILDLAEKKFGPSKNLSNVQRSLAQFYCQESLYSNAGQKVASALLFAFALPAVLLYILSQSFKKGEIKSCDVFIFRLGDLNYVKDNFTNSKIEVASEHKGTGFYLGFYEIKFLANLIFLNTSCWLKPKLLVNIVRWLATYAWVVKYYNPKIVATFFEGTAASSVLTEYLNSKNIKHYNYAHGEHFRYDCYSAYANFNKYTIWGEHFKNIQVEKHCRPEMFETQSPKAFQKFYSELRYLKKENLNRATVLIHSGVEKGKKEYESLLSFIQSAEGLTELLLRPHPVDRASWPQVMHDLQNDLKSVGKEILIKAELPEKTSMKESVALSAYFIGSASAALLEALLAGCKIIYMPGRVHNADIIERHSGSKNVMAYEQSVSATVLKEFLTTPYLVSVSEDAKLKKLFALT